MEIEIVTIGDELMLGFTLDSNGAFAARELAAIGVTISRRTSVGDDARAITEAVRAALERTGAVITTGGIGPTSDDLSKPAVAAVFGRAMRLDETIVEALRQRWIARGWGKELPESNRQQAMLPEGATVLTNRHGSAPGVWLEDARGWVAMLPGVPREMRGMFTDEVFPRVQARLGNAGDGAVVLSRVLRTTGISESLLSDRVRPIEPQLAGLSVAYLPAWPGVDLRFTSRGLARGDAEAALDAAERAAREVVGEHIYGTDVADLAAVVLGQCMERGYTVAVAESCTGGLLGGRLTAIRGSSHVFLGGVIAYSNEVKATHLGVGDDTLLQFGAVSEETAREMATGVRARFRAEVAMAITGIAGPDGGSAEKPVGTVCAAVDVKGEVHSSRRSMVGDREEIRQRAAQWVLDLARRATR